MLEGDTQGTLIVACSADALQKKRWKNRGEWLIVKRIVTAQVDSFRPKTVR
jgi:hypothetical protein